MSFLFAAVKVNDVSTTLFSTGGVTEASRFNRIMFDLNAATTSDSGSADGYGLWDLTVYGSGSIRGQGPRYNPQTYYTLSRRQQDMAARGKGDSINFGAVDINYDMSGLTCNDVRYICADLRKGNKPNPEYELVPVPDPSVMTSCMEVPCEGKLTMKCR